VRKAIDYAIDKEKISKEIFFSIFPPAKGPVSEAGEGYDPALKGYPYNPKTAKELLVQAGYPNGFKTRIIYENTVDPYVYVATQAYLKQIGIEATLEPVSTNQFGQIRAVGWENGMIRIGFPTGKDTCAQTYFGYFSRKVKNPLVP
jgi:ABC-type transport system substrate-binding protein